MGTNGINSRNIQPLIIASNGFKDGQARDLAIKIAGNHPQQGINVAGLEAALIKLLTGTLEQKQVFSQIVDLMTAEGEAD